VSENPNCAASRRLNLDLFGTEVSNSADARGLPHPREEKPTPDSWVVAPILKIVGAYERSVEQYPLIAMGTPDPYTPPK
jgi:hypothetical protein